MPFSLKKDLENADLNLELISKLYFVNSSFLELDEDIYIKSYFYWFSLNLVFT